MNKIKKILSLIVALILLMSVCACTPAEKKDSGKLKIVTTIFPPYDFARNIAGDMAEVTQLLYPGAESHSFEPTPKDIIAIKEADLFIYGGGESDTWIKEKLLSGELAGVNTLAMTDCVTLFAEEHDEREDEHEDEHGHEYDEHVWTSHENAVLICKEICKALCERDAENAAEYQRRTAEYTTKIEELSAKYNEMISNAKRKTVVFGDRFPFLYLAKEYGINYFAAFPGCSTDAEPSASTVSALVNRVRDEQIPVVFYIEFSNANVAKIISEETGAKTLILHSCHNITADELKAGASYISLMEQNLANLTEALN